MRLIYQVCDSIEIILELQKWVTITYKLIFHETNLSQTKIL